LAVLKESGTTPPSKDKFNTFVIAGSNSSTHSLSMFVGIGSSEHDAFDELRIIVNTSSGDTDLNDVIAQFDPDKLQELDGE
jgi:hypothetical protein